MLVKLTPGFGIAKEVGETFSEQKSNIFHNDHFSFGQLNFR